MTGSQIIKIRQDKPPTFILEVTDYLEYYDEDLIERTIKNDTGVIYRSAPSAEAYEDMQKLMTKVFLDRELRIRISAAYKIFPGEWVKGLKGYGCDGEFDTSMPNPYAYLYGELGRYESLLRDCVRNANDYDVIMNCIMNTKSLEVADAIPMCKFMEWMFADKYRCVELRGGEIVYPREAIMFLKTLDKKMVGGKR